MAAAAEVHAVFLYWQERMVKPRAKLDSKREEKIRSRLNDGYSVQDLKDAVDGCRQSAWHQGQNDRKRKYDDIELICRDARRVDEFIEECLKWRKIEARKKAEADRLAEEEQRLKEERASRVLRGPFVPPWKKSPLSGT